MGLFGGDSSSSSSNFYDQSKKNVEGLAEGAIGVATSGAGSSVTLNTLDGGAIAGAFDLVKANDAYNNRNYESLLQTTRETLSDIIGASNDSMAGIIGASNSSMAGILSGTAATQNFIASTQATAKGTLDSRTLMMLGLAAAAVLGIYFLKGSA